MFKGQGYCVDLYSIQVLVFAVRFGLCVCDLGYAFRAKRQSGVSGYFM